MFCKSLELLDKLYGEGSAQAVPILINMATALQKLKAFDKAEAKVRPGTLTRKRRILVIAVWPSCALGLVP